jgi:hypothetical protein
MVIKIIGLTPVGYVRDNFNIIDGIIVVIAILDYSKNINKSIN